MNFKNLIYYILLVFIILTYSMKNFSSQLCSLSNSVMPNWILHYFYAVITTWFFRLPDKRLNYRKKLNNPVCLISRYPCPKCTESLADAPTMRGRRRTLRGGRPHSEGQTPTLRGLEAHTPRSRRPHSEGQTPTLWGAVAPTVREGRLHSEGMTPSHWGKDAPTLWGSCIGYRFMGMADNIIVVFPVCPVSWKLCPVKKSMYSHSSSI